MSDILWEDETPAALVAGGVEHAGFENAPGDHLLFATSGSSGIPRWIAISKPALLASAAAVNAHLGVDAASVWGQALPMHHVGGFGVWARARVAGCGLEVFQGRWDPCAFASWAGGRGLKTGGRGLTHTSLVPTQVHDLVSAGCKAPGGLRAVVVGGGRLDAEAGTAARDLGWPVLASYGMTESASQIATQPLAALAHPYQPAPIPVLAHWQVRADGAGCLEIAGPALYSGTMENGIYRPRRGDWYATRDRVSITPGGLVPHGRADALVKVAGELIDPLEVEKRLAAWATPHGNGIAVVAVADARLGNRLAVVAEHGVPDSLLHKVIDDYNQAVPRSQRLGLPVRVAKLPRGDLGKILLARLREMAGGNL